MAMHRVLERQIHRFLKDISAEELERLAPFLNAISDTYTHADDDRRLLTHSLELSSREFVELNKKLRSENEIIEQKVRERTKELEAERAKQIVLDRAKDQFMAIASHEMRTPLAVIRGNAELLMLNTQVAGSTELKEEVESILRSAIRMLNIVNDFLDVQNLEEGRMAFKKESINVEEVTEEALQDLKKIADEKGLTLVLQKAQEPIPPVQADRTRLQQIIINLVANGIHYTKHGGVTLRIEKNADTFKILVADTGVGIDAEDQSRLFEKFQIGKTVVPSKEFGSGLGLYISNMIARRMGGEVRLEHSVVGEGSTFSLTLPVA